MIKKKGFDDDSAIFVVGMPRTGTTVVERILTQAPEVKSAGELHDFSLLTKQLSQDNSHYMLSDNILQQAEQIDFENKSIIMGGDFPYFSWNEDDERIISYFNQDVSYLINNVVPYLEFSKQNNVKMCKDIFYSSPEIVYKTAEQGVAFSKEHNIMSSHNSRTQGNYGKELFYNSLLEEKLEPVVMSLTGFEMIKYHFASITGEYDHFNNTYRSKCMDMNSNFYKSTYGIPNSNDHDQKIFQFKVEGKHLVIDLIEDMDTYFKEHDFELLQHWDIEF